MGQPWPEAIACDASARLRLRAAARGQPSTQPAAHPTSQSSNGCRALLAPDTSARTPSRRPTRPSYDATADEQVSRGHAFISYVREDSGRVERVNSALEAAGIKIWQDTRNLWPGEDWRVRIRESITKGGPAFIACFSNASVCKPSSYMNEELVLAVEHFRRARPGRVWLIPVRLDECALPEFDLGAGRRLSNLQCTHEAYERWHAWATPRCVPR